MPRVKLEPHSDEEEAAIQRGIAEDPDNPELTDEDFARMRPARETNPDIVEDWLRRTRGNKIRRHAARRTAADEPGIGNRAGVRLVELGKERGSGIGCDRRDGTGARSKAESMQRERCFPRV